MVVSTSTFISTHMQVKSAIFIKLHIFLNIQTPSEINVYIFRKILIIFQSLIINNVLNFLTQTSDTFLIVLSFIIIIIIIMNTIMQRIALNNVVEYHCAMSAVTDTK